MSARKSSSGHVESRELENRIDALVEAHQFLHHPNPLRHG